VCGSPMVMKSGRYGKFLACSRYPECKSTKPITLGIPCPRDGCTGELSERRTRKKGKIFYGCSRYPECDFAVWEKPVEAECPACGFGYASVKRTRGRKEDRLACLKCESEFQVNA
jgi:DNA topoisomerase-1